MCPQLTLPPEGQHGEHANSNECRTWKEIFLLDHMNIFHSNLPLFSVQRFRKMVQKGRFWCQRGSKEENVEQFTGN